MGYKFDLFVSKQLLEILKSTIFIVGESNYTSIFNQGIKVDCKFIKF